MKVYHGTDKEIAVLPPGAFVTRSLKDAWKFGYRKAVTDKRQTVFVYIADVDEHDLVRDPKRDRAYVMSSSARATLLRSSDVWSAPFKLSKFRFEG